MVEAIQPNVQPVQTPAIPPAEIKQSISIEIPAEILSSFKGVADTLKSIAEKMPKEEKKESAPFYRRYFYHALAAAGVAALVYYYPEEAQSALTKVQNLSMRALNRCVDLSSTALNRGLDAVPESVKNMTQGTINWGASLYNQAANLGSSLYNQTAAVIPESVKNFTQNALVQGQTGLASLKDTAINWSSAALQGAKQETAYAIQAFNEEMPVVSDFVSDTVSTGKGIVVTAGETYRDLAYLAKEGRAALHTGRDLVEGAKAGYNTVATVAGIPAAGIRGVASLFYEDIPALSVKDIPNLGAVTFACYKIVGLSTKKAVEWIPDLGKIPIPDKGVYALKGAVALYAAANTALQPSIGLAEACANVRDRTYEFITSPVGALSTVGTVATAATVYLAYIIHNMPLQYLRHY